MARGAWSGCRNRRNGALRAVVPTHRVARRSRAPPAWCTWSVRERLTRQAHRAVCPRRPAAVYPVGTSEADKKREGLSVWNEEPGGRGCVRLARRPTGEAFRPCRVMTELERIWAAPKSAVGLWATTVLIAAEVHDVNRGLRSKHNRARTNHRHPKLSTSWGPLRAIPRSCGWVGTTVSSAPLRRVHGGATASVHTESDHHWAYRPKRRLCRPFDGETRTRTGDTTIFSRAVDTLERCSNPWKTTVSWRRARFDDPRSLRSFPARCGR